MAVPGDVVAHNGGERVVVDITDDGVAVLRRHDDLELKDPEPASAESLRVIGHLDSVPGWEETRHGEWSKVPE